MKKTIIIGLAACVAVAIGFSIGRKQPAALPQTVAESAGSHEALNVPAVGAAKARVGRQTAEAGSGSSVERAAGGNALTQVTPSALAPSPVFEQALGNLLSSQVTYLQKQEAWKQLRDGGKLDSAIAELERRATADPAAPEYPAVLGQAYLQKAGTIQDVREQGILGMKADQSFEAALNLDSYNWEARFWKASAMSYWPAQLNKGKEVIENFLELMKQQETQTPQPHFAQTYVLLGEQYEKQGHPDYAAQIWKRGQAVFPGDSALQQKMSKAQ